MSGAKIVSEWKSFGGRQLVVEHASEACGVPMRFSLYLPPGVTRPPVLTFLSGLTCTWENVTTKAGFQRWAAEAGLAVVAPDTSPRGQGVPDAEGRWDLGVGAGFYVNATHEPWARHYQMDRYVTDELPQVLAGFDLDLERQGLMGHSMGGHGALVFGLRHPERYRSVSAFSPIVAPTQVPWGQQAFSAYLGDDRAAWSRYDATELVRQRPRRDITLLVDQGSQDGFLDEQLRPELFEQACRQAGQPLRLDMRDGYDHSYYFIASFMEDHVAHHARALCG